MTTFGTRLLYERKRIKLTQAEFAKVGGKEANSQIEYEKDVRLPSTEYLIRLAEVGIDIPYLFYGTRTTLSATKQVMELITVLTEMPPTQQAMSFAFLKVLQLSAKNDQPTVVDADLIWRATRLFELFVNSNSEAQTMLELAAQSLPASTKV